MRVSPLSNEIPPCSPSFMHDSLADSDSAGEIFINSVLIYFVSLTKNGRAGFHSTLGVGFVETGDDLR